jgi:hypothetical protein
LIRAYVPATLPDVVAWYRAGAIPPGAAVVAVTAALRQAHPQADDEELEYLATGVARDLAPGDRPAVLAVDLAEAAVVLSAPVPVADWAALFLDDLEWYAVEEIPHLG